LYSFKNIEVFYKEGSFDGKTILSSIYIQLNSFLLQIAIFYDRNSFYWISCDNFETKEIKTFGDKPRAVNK
jgi:hypothetical protein